MSYKRFSLQVVRGAFGNRGSFVPSLISPVVSIPCSSHLPKVWQVYLVLMRTVSRYGTVFLSVKWSAQPPAHSLTILLVFLMTEPVAEAAPIQFL